MQATRTNFIDQTIIQYKISLKTFKQLHANNLDKYQTLNLTGGIPLEDIPVASHQVGRSSESPAFIAITRSREHQTERKIFRADKFIKNLLMTVNTKGLGTGTRLFINQVIEARKLGFEFLKVSAAKNALYPDGYYTWARLGYSMDKPDELQFLELMKRFERTEQSLTELMKTENGRDFWKAKGFWWEGTFDLSDNSINLLSLQAYLASTGFLVSL